MPNQCQDMRLPTNPTSPALSRPAQPISASPLHASVQPTATQAPGAFDLVLQPHLQAHASGSAAEPAGTAHPHKATASHKTSSGAAEEPARQQAQGGQAQGPVVPVLPLPQLPALAKASAPAANAVPATANPASDDPGPPLVAEPELRAPSGADRFAQLQHSALPDLPTPIGSDVAAPAAEGASPDASPRDAASSRPQKAGAPDGAKPSHAKLAAAHVVAGQPGAAAPGPDLHALPAESAATAGPAPPTGTGNGLRAQAAAPDNASAQPGSAGAQSTTPPATPPQLVAPAAQLGHAVAALHLRSDGASQLTIRLDPAELGHIQVQIARTRDGAATISVAVEKLETLHALQADLTHLHLALDRAGVAGQRSVELQLAPPQPTPDTATPSNAFGQSGQQSGGQPGSQSAYQQAAHQSGPGLPSSARDTGTFLILPQPGAQRAFGHRAGINITA